MNSRKFNSIYGEVLIEPQALLGKYPRIKGLDGNDKMGKSLGNAIYLCDSPAIIHDKVMSAITDPNKIRKDDPANPDICMVYYYHKLFSGDEVDTVCAECKNGTRGCVACKKQLIDNICKYLEPIREKREYYLNHMDEVQKILEEGSKKAREKAQMTLKNVKKAMKIDFFNE